MKLKAKNQITNFLFMVPALILFCFIVVYPFIKGVRISLTDWDGFSTTYNFVGLKNFFKILKDPSIKGPIQNSLFFTIVTVIIDNVAGLGVAFAFRKNKRSNRIFRTCVFMPFVLSLVLTGFIWKYIYSDVFYGIFGIKSLLGNKNTVMWGICIMAFWRDIGYSMLIYLAGLQAIPDTYYEAAKIDGANHWKMFSSITLPLLAPAFTVNVTLFLGWGLKVFDYVMAATNGGPGRTSETFAMYVYNYTFPYNRAGYGQAAAILMMVFIFIISGIVSTLLRRREIDM
ncbi:carbohydrate ABC transporter permease [Blautia luti]|uniref:Lactose transport system permease protein LacF n=1 Tax=Blautia luti TaxID=89014 RepID=A0A564W5Z8_9FIRM|nr:sugar ABC transporter permease [Blautia luti]VUX39422.1 Lactose transport system permease protein LacF [Blautia luti]